MDTAGIMGATNVEKRKKPCKIKRVFYVSEGSVGLQSSTLKGQCTVASKHESVGVNEGTYFGYFVYIVAADNLDNVST